MAHEVLGFKRLSSNDIRMVHCVTETGKHGCRLSWTGGLDSCSLIPPILSLALSFLSQLLERRCPAHEVISLSDLRENQYPLKSYLLEAHYALANPGLFNDLKLRTLRNTLSLLRGFAKSDSVSRPNYSFDSVQNHICTDLPCVHMPTVSWIDYGRSEKRSSWAFHPSHPELKRLGYFILHNIPRIFVKNLSEDK